MVGHLVLFLLGVRIPSGAKASKSSPKSKYKRNRGEMSKSGACFLTLRDDFPGRRNNLQTNTKVGERRKIPIMIRVKSAETLKR